MSARLRPQIRSDNFWRASSAIAVLVGVVVLTGWGSDIEWLGGFFGTVRMKANTAASFALLGIALALLAPAHIGQKRKVLGIGCAVMVALVGLATLGEWVLSRDFRIDQLLFTEEAGAVGTSAPGRMAETTAACFILAGSAACLLRAPKIRYAEGLSVALGACALFGFSAFLLDPQALTGLGRQTQMAVPTAFTFLVLSAGMLTARRGQLTSEVLSPLPGGVAARLIIPAAVAVPLGLGRLIQNGVRSGTYSASRGDVLQAMADICVLTAVAWITARLLNRAAADAERQRAYLAAIVGSASDAIMTRLPDGTITSWNASAEKIFGYAAAEVIGRRAGFLSPEELREEAKRLLEDVEDGSQLREFETVGVAKDGRRIPVSISGFQILGEGSIRLGTGLAIRDISERLRIEDGKRLQRERAETLLRLNQMVGDPIERIEGFIVEQSVSQTASGMGFCGVIDEDEGAMISQVWGEQAMKECTISEVPPRFPIEGGGLWADVVRRREPIVVNDDAGPVSGKRGIPPGHIPLTRFLGVPVLNDGKVVAVIAVANKAAAYGEAEVQHLRMLADGVAQVLLRRQADEAMRQSEMLLRATFEQAAVGIAHVATDGRWLRVNQKLCDMLGYTHDELLHKSFPDLTHPDDLQPDMESMPRLLSRQIQSYTHQKRYIRKDGSYLWVDLHVSLVRTASGEPDYFISITQDITERKLAEVEREQLELQLRQAQKMEAVGQLAAGVAHDFNNKLAVIMGYADMALRGLGSSASTREDIEEIRTAAMRSAELTQQLLAFARMQPIAPERLDLNETIHSMLAMLAQLIGEDVHLVWSPGDRPCLVRIDPGQIDQVLVNLVVNARDAILGQGTITIATKNVELGRRYIERGAGHAAPGRFVVLEVSDDGCGMDEETKARSIEPFFTTKPLGKGTGLGLATVHGIAHQNHGFVELASQVRVGTTISVCLPAEAEDAAVRALDTKATRRTRGGNLGRKVGRDSVANRP